MIGSGRANVSEVCDLARANLADGLPFEALKAFGSLGAGGRHCSNQERDLHKWLHSLFGLKLTTYKVKMFLNVPSEEKPVGVDVPFLLPHEVIHALSNAGQLQFARSMTGHRSRASIVKFWQHCVGLEEWAHHPSLQNPETYDCMLPLALHVDGAEFYSNSEYLCWSMCSVLSSEHVFDSKFPVVVLPHSSMLDERVKAHVHATVSRVLAWSLRCASSGVAPSTGVFDEPLLGERATLAGQQLANGWKGCFFGFRFDEKARKEVNAFTRSYQHSLVCMRCMAQRLHKNWVPALHYKNFHRSAILTTFDPRIFHLMR